MYGLAAAAAKSLQSCPTLCDPRDGSPPGSLLPGILQARTLHTFKYTIMVTSYHTMFSHNIVYYYGIMGILPLSHFNRQGKLRSREVKSNARSHIAGMWPRWDSYPDVLDSRLRGCSPSQTERSPTKEGFHAFGRMQPGGSLWDGSGLAGPHIKRPHRQRQCIKASPSVQTFGQHDHTRTGWGKGQETYLEDGCLQMLLPQPLHSTTSQASRSFTLAAVPFNNLIWHQESPDSFLLSSQTLPPTWPQKMASGSKRHPPEKAPLGSPGELASMKDSISEASQGQMGTTEGATSPGYVSFVLQATSLHCQQKSKGEMALGFTGFSDPSYTGGSSLYMGSSGP